MDERFKNLEDYERNEEKKKLNAGLMILGFVFYACIWGIAGVSFLFFWGANLSEVGEFAYAFFLIGCALLGAGGWLIMISYGDYVEQITRKLIKLENKK